MRAPTLTPLEGEVPRCKLTFEDGSKFLMLLELMRIHPFHILISCLAGDVIRGSICLVDNECYLLCVYSLVKGCTLALSFVLYFAGKCLSCPSDEDFFFAKE